MNNYFVFSLIIAEVFAVSGEFWNQTDCNSRSRFYNRYDFIVVGAGASGATVAARLSQNPNISVLLIEAGGFPLKLTDIPYFAASPVILHDWGYQTERQEFAFLQYNDQKTSFPRGKGLGGSTLINGLVATRGCKRDYDLWSELGNDGWDYQSLLPFFQKLEDYQAEIIQDEDRNYHGFEGPVNIADPGYITNLEEAFVQAVKQTGYPVLDYNAKTLTGVGNPVFMLRKGRRCSTYTAYIKPAMKRNNFHVATYARVTKILFDEHKRAIGVEFESKGRKRTIYSSKEVIVSGGSINSPQLLMVSGIGPEETLSRYNIPVVINLQGVGQNLQDHLTVIGVTFTANAGVGINHTTAMRSTTMEQWETKGEGPLAVPNRAQGIAFLNTKFADESIDYPDMEMYLMQPAGQNLVLDREVVYVFPVILRPESKGYVSIRSASGLDDPIIQPNYLSNPKDVEVLVDAIKKTYQVMNQSSMLELGIQPLDINLPACQQFTHYSDDYFRCQIRNYSALVFHPLGTCKMGPNNDPMAVVDNRLRVYGTKNLRVVDASIFPSIPSTHTTLPCIMTGEKAAVMIAEDWKFRI